MIQNESKSFRFNPILQSVQIQLRWILKIQHIILDHLRKMALWQFSGVQALLSWYGNKEESPLFQ